MDSQEFVDALRIVVRALRIVVRDGAIGETINILQRPPGRRPPEELLKKTAWYNSLDDVGKENLSLIVQEAVDGAIFGVLCVLDGARSIENGSDKGRLELHYIKNGSTILNPPEGGMLHELWR